VDHPSKAFKKDDKKVDGKMGKMIRKKMMRKKQP
jgi:hypothetical protein